MIFNKATAVYLEGEEKTLNGASAFYVKFNKIPQAELVITACNFYQAYLNGKLIAFGSARGAHGYFRADRISLKDLKEENTLFIEVVAYNTLNYWAIDCPGFLQAEITSSGEAVLWTGRDFLSRVYTEKLKKVSRFAYQRAFTESYIFTKNPIETYVDIPSSNERWLAPIPVPSGKIIERGANYPTYQEFNSSEMERGKFTLTNIEPYLNTCMEMENLKIYPKSEWESDPSEYVSRLKYEKQNLVGDIKAGEYAVFDFGVAETGFIKINLTAKSASNIFLIFDEINLNEDKSGAAEIFCYRNNCVNIIEYKMEKGECIHSSFEPYTARYVKVIVKSGELSALKVSLISYSNPDADKFKFSCEDNRLEEIVEAARRTFRHNAVDVLTDCPSRERAGWLCDAFFSARAEKLFTGENKVEKDFLENFALCPTVKNVPDGMIPMCYPADFEKETYIPNWAMWYIVEIYDEHLRTGDLTVAKMSEDKIRKLLKFYEKYINSDGLLENLDGWIFVEWSMANDLEFTKGVNYPSNMMYATALQKAGELYNDLSLIEKAEKIKDTIRRQSYNGEFFEDNAVRENGELRLVGHISETCQYYAFFSGVASPQNYPELFKTLVEHFGATRDINKVYPAVYKSNAFIGNYLRLMMLAEFGKKQCLAKECVEFFYNMAKTTGTLWENDSSYGSLDHGFASYAANLIVDYLCGFRGVFGKTIVFEKAAVSIDCELHIPINSSEIIFKRQGGKEEITVPNGYAIMK